MNTTQIELERIAKEIVELQRELNKYVNLLHEIYSELHETSIYQQMEIDELRDRIKLLEEKIENIWTIMRKRITTTGE